MPLHYAAIYYIIKYTHLSSPFPLLFSLFPIFFQKNANSMVRSMGIYENAELGKNVLSANRQTLSTVILERTDCLWQSVSATERTRIYACGIIIANLNELLRESYLFLWDSIGTSSLRNDSKKGRKFSHTHKNSKKILDGFSSFCYTVFMIDFHIERRYII